MDTAGLNDGIVLENSAAVTFRDIGRIKSEAG